jgi:hypothetical protein
MIPDIMKIKRYQVEAITCNVFGGNPVPVCIL